MASDYTHVPTQGSVSEVLKLVVIEHRELRAQYREVSTRIRNLRIAVRTLRNLGGKARVGRREKNTATDTESDGPRGGEDAIEGNVSDAQPERQDLALRRAIRIAVLEFCDVVSNEEIYARILRRGSFAFSNRDLATQAIAEELNAMAAQGELLRVDTATGDGWQRIRE